MFETIFAWQLESESRDPSTLPQILGYAEVFLLARAKYQQVTWRLTYSQFFPRIISLICFNGPLFRQYNFNPGAPLYAPRTDTHIISYEVL